jgi:iron complex outermembrane recepter protein
MLYMNKHNELVRSIRYALTIGLIGAVTAPVALAQDEAAEEETLEAVEVLGSRIRRVQSETAQPVLSFERGDIEKTGLTSIAEVLKEISVNGPSLSLNTNNGNTSGNSGVNLRNCASNRTLVLVNGRRWVSNNGLAGSVDLSSIPLAAVERFEILKDGASALYGTDAICGVINIQTRNNFEGMQADVSYGEFSEGDGERQSLALTAGGSNDKFSGLFNVAYTEQKPVFAGDREISAVPLFGFPANVSAPGRASGVGPFGNFTVTGRGNITLDPTKPGCAANAVCAPARAGDFKPYDFQTDGYNFAPDNYLVQPQKVYSAFAQMGYQIGERIRAESELFYTNRNGDAQLAAQPLSPLTISATSIYNPFGVAITGAAFRPTVQPRSFGQDQDTWRFSGGLEGDFDLAERTFYWDAGYTFARNKQVQVKNGFYFASRINDATGPSFVDGAGVARCGTPTAVIAGCVPLNVMGGPNGLTQAMLNYVTVAPRNLQESDQKSYTANITGDLFEMSGGPLSFAFGIERREESGSDNPDPLTNAGLVLGDNPVQPTAGKFDVNEAYGEFRIPLLSDVTLAKSLELSLAARYSDYSSFGDTTNPKVSLRWLPIDDLVVRGSFGKGFRAPSVSELFSGNGTGRPAFQDLCSATNPTFIASATTRAACLANGAPVGFTSRLSQTFLTTGGNANLQPETSESTTFGAVYSPEWADGLDLYVDWYNIEIANSIGANGVNTILDGCYIQLNPDRCALITRDRTGAVNGNIGEISNIDSRNQNFRGGLETEGFDFGGGYRFDTENWGKFITRLDSTYVTYFGDLGKPNNGELNADGDISDGNLVGRLPAGSSGGAPRHRLRSNLVNTWTYGDFSVTATLEYRSRVNESCNNVFNTATNLGARNPSFLALRDNCSDPNRNILVYQFQPGTSNVIAVNRASPRNKLGGVTYTHLQGSWNAPWDGTATLGVRNLFEKDPPFSSDAFANSFDAQYLIPGRYFYFNYSQKF